MPENLTGPVETGSKQDSAEPYPARPVDSGHLDEAAAPLTAAVEKLEHELRSVLHRLTVSADHDPFSNPVLRLSLNLSQRIDAGSLSHGTIEQLIQHLTVKGFIRRAERLSHYIGEDDPEKNAATLRTCIRSLAVSEHGEPVPFEQFEESASREIFGIVFTAHPTFNVSGKLMSQLTMLATGRMEDGTPLSSEGRAALIAEVASVVHRPDEDLSLTREHSLSLTAIANVQSALRQLYGVVFSIAEEIYPDRWTTLKPRLITVASWVGYDLDGRSDIRWSDTLRNRLIVQLLQLRQYQAEIRALVALRTSDDLRLTCELLESRLALAGNGLEEEIAVLEGDLEAESTRSGLQRIGRRMHQSLALRLVDTGQAIGLIERAIGQARSGDDDPMLLRGLCVLRAELANYGLAMVHTHVRINATQIHNAIRKVVGLETSPDDPRYRQSYLTALNDLLQDVKPVSVNFGTMLAEKTSAKRLFMVIAQMLKYADATTPVRFLIAECETAFTAMTALYYAELFGVADKVDISPLFETERALEVGSRVIDQLLENAYFRRYVERRGRLCIQTGYSDAGRYLGQTPAAGSIERLKMRITRLFKKHGLADVQLVIFDTHGESIGRGAHPASFHDRLAYIATPRHLATLQEEGVSFKQETSFQGGDGYLYFATSAAAFAVITRIITYFLQPPIERDPYYENADYDYVTEFFTTVKAFQVSLMRDPNYAALLNAFGTNLIFPSGSRALKRQHDSQETPDQQNAAQLRAIPHNAILLQLGISANAIGGVGEAVDKDPQRFAALYQASPRFRRMLGIVEYGMGIACPAALKAHVDTLDPGLWLLRAAASSDMAAAECRNVAGILERLQMHARQIPVWRRLFADLTLLRTHVAKPAAPPLTIEENTAVTIRLLHAIRLTLIHEIFRLATHIPEFSSQHSTTHDRIIHQIVRLDIPAAISDLRRIFPTLTSNLNSEDYGEPATYISDDSQSYAQENERIFDPMMKLYELIRRIGTGLTHHYGFLG